MIHIHYQRDENTHHLHICGHAGYAEHGRDIVCAGVSALSFALLDYLRQTGTPVEEAACRRGRLDLRCRGGEQADSAFDMALCGWRQIAETYPQWVEVDITPRQEAGKREQTAGKEHEHHAE